MWIRYTGSLEEMLLFSSIKADSGPPGFGPPFKTGGLERETASSSVHAMWRLQGYKHCLAEALEYFLSFRVG